jgi:hypothetical protein
MSEAPLLSPELRLRAVVVAAMVLIAAIGVGSVYVFKTDISRQSYLVGTSCRARVGPGAEAMIAGFIIRDHVQTVVIRAAGPSLAAVGVTDAVANTMLRVVRQSDGQEIAQNDDWRAPGNERLQADLADYAPKDPREAACVLRLRPDAYSAIVEGKAGARGVGLVEVFCVSD